LTVVVVVVGLCVRWFSQTRLAARAASCPNDVHELFCALRLYAADHDGLVPPLSAVRGNITVDPDGFYPHYLSNSCWVQCEYSPIRQGSDDKDADLGLAGFNDDSFFYLPWEMRDEEEALAFITAYRTLDLSRCDDDLTVEIDGESRVLPRVGLSREVMTQGREDGAPYVPIIVEWPNHAHIKGTVYYSNGFRRLMDVGEAFPMTERILAGLREIASLDKPVPEWKIR